MISSVESAARRYAKSLPCIISLVVVSAAVSACGASHTNGGSAGAPRTYKVPQTSVSQIALDYLVPTNGNEAAIALNDVNNYETAVSAKATDRCLAADGLPPIATQPEPGLSGVEGLPNLAYISTHPAFNVGLVHINDPTKGMGAAERRAYVHAVKRCTPLIPMALATKQANQIWGVWMVGVIPAVTESGAVRAANRAGAACSRSTAFPASSFNDELKKVYAAADRYYSNPKLSFKQAITDGNRVEARGTPVFVRCFGPAVRTLDRLLAKRAKSYLARNALEIQQVQNQLAMQFAAQAKKYDVPLSTAKLYTRG